MTLQYSHDSSELSALVAQRLDDGPCGGQHAANPSPRRADFSLLITSARVPGPALTTFIPAALLAIEWVEVRPNGEHARPDQHRHQHEGSDAEYDTSPDEEHYREGRERGRRQDGPHNERSLRLGGLTLTECAAERHHEMSRRCDAERLRSKRAAIGPAIAAAVLQRSG